MIRAREAKSAPVGVVGPVGEITATAELNHRISSIERGTFLKLGGGVATLAIYFTEVREAAFSFRGQGRPPNGSASTLRGHFTRED